MWRALRDGPEHVGIGVDPTSERRLLERLRVRLFGQSVAVEQRPQLATFLRIVTVRLREDRQRANVPANPSKKRPRLKEKR